MKEYQEYQDTQKYDNDAVSSRLELSYFVSSCSNSIRFSSFHVLNKSKTTYSRILDI